MFSPSSKGAQGLPVDGTANHPQHLWRPIHGADLGFCAVIHSSHTSYHYYC